MPALVSIPYFCLSFPLYLSASHLSLSLSLSLFLFLNRERGSIMIPKELLPPGGQKDFCRKASCDFLSPSYSPERCILFRGALQRLLSVGWVLSTVLLSASLNFLIVHLVGILSIPSILSHVFRDDILAYFHRYHNHIHCVWTLVV